MNAENWHSFYAEPRIKVLGLGGAGGKAINYMIDAGLPGAEFVFADTDSQYVHSSKAAAKIRLDLDLRNLSYRREPDIGRIADRDDMQLIADAIDGADMVVILAGLGGYTGSSAVPVAADLANKLGILTIVVVTTPFHMEGVKRSRCAAYAIEEALSVADLLIPIPCSEKFLKVRGDMTLLEAFRRANEAVFAAVRGLVLPSADLGLIRFDFSDLHSVTRKMGLGAIGMGIGSGENRVDQAVEEAFAEFATQGIDASRASSLLVDIAAGAGIESGIGDPVSLGECQYAVQLVSKLTGIEYMAIATTVDPQLDRKLRLTVIVAGLDAVAGGMPTETDELPSWLRRKNE
jgi:cell division protein FtsZ